MRFLVVAARGGTRRVLRRLAARGCVEIEWRAADDGLDPPPQGCDAVLIDGSAARDRDAAPFLDQVARLRRRMPGVPVLVLSRLGDPRAGSRCGVLKRDGTFQAHCRLRSLAWSETEALLADALERELAQPVVFEFQG